MQKEDSCWNNFINSHHSKATIRQYQHAMKNFMLFHKESQPSQLLEGSKTQKEQMLINFIVSYKKKGATPATISCYMSALWHFYQYDDI
jgi:site-specific recombinase XerD